MDWFFGLSGLVLAVVGIYLALKFRSRKLLCFDFRENDLFRFLEEKGDVRVFFKTSEVERVVNRRVIFWNPGSVEIRRADVDERERIGLKLSEGTGYVVSKHEIIGAISGFEVIPSQDGLFIEFDVFDKQSAVVIEMQELFSQSASERPTSISGRIFGSTSPIRRVNVFDIASPRTDALAWLLVSVTAVIFAGSQLFENSSGFSERDMFEAIAFSAIFILIFLLFSMPRMLSLLRFRPPAGVYEWI